MQDLQDIANKLGNLEDVGLKVQAERIQLAIAERLDGILTALKSIISDGGVINVKDSRDGI